MRSLKLTRTKAAVLVCLFAAFLSACSSQQTATKPGASNRTAPPPGTVAQIDEVELGKLSVPDGRPLLINFWATWCGPCREEFPDLVKLDQEFKGKIDFITISLDDPGEITTSVPEFLTSVKAEMPAYLLKAADDSAVIDSVSKQWHGGLPFTILYDPKGTPVYEREGKVNLDVVRSAIEKNL